ncbi:hypothetical protein HETIRDRAFT_25122, partial [Heterobasidion irregulare TC 32-1]
FEIAAAHTLASQVGGHAGVLTTEDGSLIIKPALALEHQFYQQAAADPALAPLQRWIPRFYGTLRLEGRTGPGGEIEIDGAGSTGAAVQKDEHLLSSAGSLVLENLAHAFARPNILDAKLGTVLFDEDAPPEKRARMEKTARETTSKQTGVRLTGFQVFDNATRAPVNTPKAYGKSLAPADLPAGIAKFFPIAAPAPVAAFAFASDSTPAVPSPSRSPSPSDASPPTTGLPARTLLPILSAIARDVRAVRAALAGVEMRMVGGSLLVVYEAEWARAAAGVEWLAAHPDGKPGPPYIVRLIDFAHTRLKPGEGPDLGVLQGVDTILRLLQGRMAEVQ